MTKTERLRHANILIDALQVTGAATNYCERKGDNRGTVDARWYDPRTNKLKVACMIWIGTIGGGGHTLTLHWYDAQSPLNPEVLHNVNPAHGRKATSGFVGEDYMGSILLACAWIGEHADDFIKGTIFLPVPVNG